MDNPGLTLRNYLRGKAVGLRKRVYSPEQYEDQNDWRQDDAAAKKWEEWLKWVEDRLSIPTSSV